MSLNEADTCRVYVTPRLRAAGWEDPPHLIAEQQTFSDGRARIVAGKALTNLNQDLVAKHPHYVERITSDEGDIGRGFLSHFQDPEQLTPVIVTTSQMLTTGVDVPTCKNVDDTEPGGDQTHADDGDNQDPSRGGIDDLFSTSTAPSPVAFSTPCSTSTRSTARGSSRSPTP